MLAHSTMTKEQLQQAREAVNRLASHATNREVDDDGFVQPLNPAGLEIDLQLEGDTPEARADDAVAKIVDQFHGKAGAMLNQMALWEPEKALRFYLDLLEFKLPKLARTEQKISIDNRTTFVHVETREKKPDIALLQAEDGTFAAPDRV